MMDALADAYARVLVRWVDGTRRFAWAIVLAAVALTAAAGHYVAGTLSISTDTSDMLSPDLAFRQHSNALSEAFPQFSDNIVVVVDGLTPGHADDAADRLVARLETRPELFGSVYDLAGHPFFRRNGLLYEDVEDLADLADRLAEAQPFLGALWGDPSLRGLASMLDRAADRALEEGMDLPIDLAPVLERMARVTESQAAGAPDLLAWQRLMQGEDAGTPRRVFLIQPAMDFGSLNPAEDAMQALRAEARDLGLTPANGLRVRLTGSAALAQEELESVRTGMGLAGVLSLVLVLGLLLWGLRSPRLVIGTLASLLMGLVWTAAFAVWAIGQLNLISVAFAVLFIGLSVDFGIHFALRYRETVDFDGYHDKALRDAARGVGGALTLCAVSAAIAFYSFLPTAYLGLAELGLIAGTGMFIALLANLTVLPAILSLLPARRRRRPGHEARFALRAQGFVQNHARGIVWTAAGLGVAAALLLPEARFDFDPLNLKDPDTESVSTLFDLMEDDTTSPYSITILADDLEKAESLGERLAALPEVDSTRSLADYVPAEQEDKLAIIGDMAFFLLPSLSGEPGSQAPAAPARDTLAAVAARLAASDRPEAAAAARLKEALAALPDGAPAAEELERRLLATLPGRLRALKTALQAQPVSLEDLPQGLQARMVAEDGRAKLEVHPVKDLRDRDALVAFVEAVRGIAPTATGSPVVIMEAGDTVVRAFIKAGLIAIAGIGLLMVLLLGRLHEVLMVFAPLVLAALLTVAASVLLGLPFNFANVIVLPLLFGLGVAGGIHLVLRDRRERTLAGVLGTSTPRAVVFSALTTIGSFGSIALSGHPGTASMGLLLTVAIALTLACTLLVLPALMAVVEGRRQEEETEA